MPSNVSHPCAAKGPTGKPCRRMVKSETGTDPDGQFRCFSHTTDPARAERRRVTSESDENRRAGREGKRRHVATARAVAAHERAAGVGPAPRGRRGGSGLPLPPGVKVPKEGEPIFIPAEAVEAQKAEAADLMAAIHAHDGTTERGRVDARKDVARAMGSGLMGPAQGAVLHQMIQAQQKDAAASDSKRTTQVRFATIETRAQADAYREAQLIKQGLASVDGDPT